MAEKTYINGLFIKKRATQYGDMINVSINVDRLLEDLTQHRKNGYVNITFMNRKEPDKNGNNMYAVLDTFEPKAKAESNGQSTNDINDDLPF